VAKDLGSAPFWGHPVGAPTRGSVRSARAVGPGGPPPASQGSRRARLVEALVASRRASRSAPRGRAPPRRRPEPVPGPPPPGCPRPLPAVSAARPSADKSTAPATGAVNRHSPASAGGVATATFTPGVGTRAVPPGPKTPRKPGPWGRYRDGRAPGERRSLILHCTGADSEELALAPSTLTESREGVAGVEAQRRRCQPRRGAPRTEPSRAPATHRTARPPEGTGCEAGSGVDPARCLRARPTRLTGTAWGAAPATRGRRPFPVRLCKALT
jgi:hypothetical protein